MAEKTERRRGIYVAQTSIDKKQITNLVILSEGPYAFQEAAVEESRGYRLVKKLSVAIRGFSRIINSRFYFRYFPVLNLADTFFSTTRRRNRLKSRRCQ